jgi:hypothetical protein
MRDIRDNPDSMWHKLVDQVGPFWIAVTEMVAHGEQMHSLNCSYRCVDFSVVEHFADNYGFTNIGANAMSPGEVRDWLRSMVELYYAFLTAGGFPKMLWGEGEWQHLPEMISPYHISPPLWWTYDPCG